MTPAVEVFPDSEALARRAADWITEAARATVGNFALASAGGATPRPLYELLARAPYRDAVPWQRMQVFWGDERFVPKNDERSNFRMSYDGLVSRVPIPANNVHPIPTEATTPFDAALAYEHTLKSYYGAERLDPKRPLFDLTLLGLGEDGHIASLFPGSQALSERERWAVAVTDGPAEPRITLTLPALESSRHVLFLVSGEGKRAILERIRRGVGNLPASRLRPNGRVLWLVDAAAAGK